MSRTSLGWIVVFFILPVVLSGCSTTILRYPVPENLVDIAEVSGIANARFWGDDVPPMFEQNVLSMTAVEARKAYPAMYGRQHNYLV